LAFSKGKAKENAKKYYPPSTDFSAIHNSRRSNLSSRMPKNLIYAFLLTAAISDKILRLFVAE
jgi:hypothetical protein